MRTPARILITLVVAAVACLAVGAASASASFTSTLNGRTLFLNGTTGPDKLIIKPKSNDNGVLDVDLNGDGLGDSLFAKDGIDHLEIGAGAGDDIVSMTGTSGLTTRVFAGSGNDSVTGGVAFDHFLGGPGNDILQGNSKDDWVEGEGDDDEIVWGSFDGADIADGGPGQDRLLYAGGNNAEHVSASTKPGGIVRIDADGPASIDASNLEGAQIPLLDGADTWDMAGPLPFRPLVQGGPGNDHLTGSDGPEVLVGDQDSDVVDARGGDDIVEEFFGGGLDTIDGGAGHDQLLSFGTSGADLLTLNPSTPGHTAIALAGQGADDYAGIEQHIIAARQGDDTVRTSAGVPSLHVIGEQGDDTLEGGDAADQLDGREGADTLDGKGGDDKLFGGSGTDNLTGGPGADAISCGGLGDTLADLAPEDVLDPDCGERPADPAPPADPGSTVPPQQPAPAPAPSPAPPAPSCVVPKLKKLTLAKAKKRLQKAHCNLGKVKKPRGKARGRLVVRRQSVKPGAVRKANSKVSVSLVRKR